MKIERACQYCGKKFFVIPWAIKVGRGKYCSRECVANAKRERFVKGCEVCGKKFITYPCKTEKRKIGRFCSLQCYGSWVSQFKVKENSFHWKGGKIERVCKMCGGVFLVFPSKIKLKRGRFCSRQCLAKWQSQFRAGVNSPTWKRVERVCKICGKKFKIKLSHAKRGTGAFCSQRCAGIYNFQHSKIRDTIPEQLIRRELEGRNIKFISQFILKGIGVADFYLPDCNAIIECDGDYWHRIPGAQDKDLNRDFQLNFQGYKTYRFWESEIKESAKRCVSKILRENPV